MIRVLIAGAWGSMVTQAVHLGLWRDARVEIAGIELGRLQHDAIAENPPDLLLSAAHRYMIPAHTLALPRIGAVGFHPSLLPTYRGSWPLWWALRYGESRAGITMFVLEEGMDAGNILEQSSTDIRSGDTFERLYRRVAPLAIPMTEHLIDAVAETRQLPEGTPQDDAAATYVKAPTLTERAIGRAVMTLRR